MIQTKKTLVKLAAYYEKNLTDDQIEMYSKQLFEYLTNEEASKACKIYIDNPENEFFPRPISKLISLIKNPISVEDDSQDIASKIISAVSKFGWNNYDDAKTYIGARGFDVVKRFGGWQYVCQELGQNIQLTTFNAQIRELLKSTSRIESVKQDDVSKIELMPKNLIDFKVREIEK